MWIDCPRAITEPPTCDGEGMLEFSVSGPEYDVNAGPQPECITKDCTCGLTDTEWGALEDQAVARYYEGPSDDT